MGGEEDDELSIYQLSFGGIDGSEEGPNATRKARMYVFCVVSLRHPHQISYTGLWEMVVQQMV